MGWRGDGMALWRAWPVLVALVFAAQPVQALAQQHEHEQPTAAIALRAGAQAEEGEERGRRAAGAADGARGQPAPARSGDDRLAGRPLIIGGEVEIETSTLWHAHCENAQDRSDRSFLELGAWRSRRSTASVCRCRCSRRYGWRWRRAGMPATAWPAIARRFPIATSNAARCGCTARTSPAPASTVDLGRLEFRGRSPLVVGR